MLGEYEHSFVSISVLILPIIKLSYFSIFFHILTYVKWYIQMDVHKIIISFPIRHGIDMNNKLPILYPYHIKWGKICQTSECKILYFIIDTKKSLRNRPRKCMMNWFICRCENMRYTCVKYNFHCNIKKFLWKKKNCWC